MTNICVDGEFLLGLLNEIGRKRALADHETDIVQSIVEATTEPFRWTDELVIDLIAAADTGYGVRRFARRNGITYGQAHQKLHRERAAIRKRKGRKVHRIKLEG